MENFQSEFGYRESQTLSILQSDVKCLIFKNDATSTMLYSVDGVVKVMSGVSAKYRFQVVKCGKVQGGCTTYATHWT